MGALGRSGPLPLPVSHLLAPRFALCAFIVCWQRGYLEKSLDALKRKSAKDASVFASDRSKLLRENSIVTTEINALRYVACLFGRSTGLFGFAPCTVMATMLQNEFFFLCFPASCVGSWSFVCFYSLVHAGVRSGGCSRTLCATSWG